MCVEHECGAPVQRVGQLTNSYLSLHAPDLDPVEGIWSLLRRGRLSNVAFAPRTPHPPHPARAAHIQDRSDLIDGCSAETDLAIRPD